MTAKAKLLAVMLLLLVMPTGAVAQQELCLPNGVPAGSAWTICVHPWTPVEGSAFEMNFSGELCSASVQHEFEVQLVGNVYTIYYDFIRGFCPGVPGTPRHFSEQPGVAAGDYVVRLYQRRVETLPPPPFDPSEYTFVREANFTVQGAPPPPAPVPVFGLIGIAGLALGIVLCATVASRRRRKLNYSSNY